MSLQQIGAGKCKVRAGQEAHPEVDGVFQDMKAAKYCFGIDDMLYRGRSEARIPEVDNICQDTKVAKYCFRVDDMLKALDLLAHG